MGAVLACVLVLSYGELIGAFGSAKRAVFMMICGFFADICRRTYDPLTALGLAAVYISWEYPYQLLQSGFQLSFGAVLGICLLGIFREREREGKTERKAKTKRKSKKGLVGKVSVWSGKKYERWDGGQLGCSGGNPSDCGFSFF